MIFRQGPCRVTGALIVWAMAGDERPIVSLPNFTLPLEVVQFAKTITLPLLAGGSDAVASGEGPSPRASLATLPKGPKGESKAINL